MSFRIELKNGEVIYPDISSDPFLKSFYDVLSRRETCDKCELFKFPRQGDFSIGDFWGIEQHDLSWEDGKGVSLVLANNDKANAIAKEIALEAFRCEEVPLEWCLNKGNRIGSDGRSSHKNKTYFNWLCKRKTLKESVNMALECKYDIGCVCMFNLNIGNNLTNLALFNVLSDMGLATLMIAPPSDFGLIINGDLRDRLSKFKENPYPDWAICERYQTKWDYYDLNNKCDLFVVGCDQLWRGCYLQSYDFFFCLDWVRSDKYKMSYSTSFGTDYYDGDEQTFKKQACLLKSINNISVREESGRVLVNGLNGRSAEVVLDPVFMCDFKLYNNMADIGRERMPKGKYVGAYLLDPTKSKERLLLETSANYYEGLYCAITDIYTNIRDDCKIDFINEPYVEEWLEMIRGCDFFITDSFHGICFAIIFKKQFCVVFDEDNWRGYDRIKYILDLFNLTDRKCTKADDLINIFNTTIDYDEVYNTLDNRKKESLDYLSKSIHEGKNYKSSITEMDLLLERECILGKQTYDIKCNIQFLKSKRFIDSFYRGDANMDEVIGFGSGACFRRNIKKLKEITGLHYVCDNNPEKWGKTLEENIICISPKMLSEMINPMVIILIDDISISFDVSKQLIDMGITHFTHIENWNRDVI